MTGACSAGVQWTGTHSAGVQGTGTHSAVVQLTMTHSGGVQGTGTHSQLIRTLFKGRPVLKFCLIGRVLFELSFFKQINENFYFNFQSKDLTKPQVRMVFRKC